MREENILQAFSQVDDAFIEEASPQNDKRKRSYKKRWIAAAASFALIGTGVISMWRLGVFERKWPEKILHYESVTVEKIPKWEELTISEQYNIVDYNGTSYDSKMTKVPADKIADTLGKRVLTTSYDTLKEQKTIEASLYRIKGISPDCAIALKFPEKADYYVYVNCLYEPKTLGQLIDDLNLKENMTFGSVWYDTMSITDKIRQVEFVDLKDEVVWQMLLKDTNLKAVTGVDFDKRDFVDNMSISVDIPLLGYKNISLGVTEDGYLTTNILDTGKAFYIGEEKVKEFMDYVIDHCTGYSIKRVPTDDGSIPEGVPE